MQTPSHTPTETERTVALWLAQGAQPTSIRNRVGVELAEIAAMQERPEFMLFVDEIRKELTATSPVPVEDIIQNLTRDTISIIQHHMYSGNEKVSLDAAKTFFDRQVPKRTQNENLNKTVIKIESGTLDTVMTTFRQMAGLGEAELKGLSKEEQLKLIKEKALEVEE